MLIACFREGLNQQRGNRLSPKRPLRYKWLFPLARARIALHDHSRGPMAEGEAQFISPDEFMAGLQAMGFTSHLN